RLQTRQPPAPAAALAAYWPAVALRKDCSPVLTNLGLALAEVGQQDDALACLEKAVGLNKGFAPYRLNYGSVLRQAGQYGRARAELDEALRLRPGYTAAMVERATVEREDGKLDASIAWLRKAVDSVPADNPLRTNLALRLQQVQRLPGRGTKLERVLAG